MSAHQQCVNAECNICRGSTRIVGPNPDTTPELPGGWDVTVQRTERKHWKGHTIVRWAYVVHRPGWWAQVSRYQYGSDEAAMRAGLADAAGTAELVEREANGEEI